MPRQYLRPNGAIRARHVKSRRACLTCRARHVRCDETFPRCRNCTSSGRVCEGVPSTHFIFITTHPKPLKPRPFRAPTQPLLSSAKHAADEHRSFDFFLSKVAPLFAVGSLDSAFWNTLIPQLSKVHPTIWDAVVSIALLFEHPFGIAHHSSNEIGLKTNPQQLKALKWYSRAVSSVARRRDLGADDEVSALLTCVLFVALEFQQGNTRQAMTLMAKGVELLSTYLSSPPTCALDQAHESKAIAEVVIPFFSRHAIFISTLGLPLLSSWPEPPLSDHDIKSEQTAPHSLVSLTVELHTLVYQAHHLVRSTLLILHDEQELSRMHMRSRQLSLLAELNEWQHRFSLHASQESSKIASTHSQLRLYYLVAHTWTSTCLSHHQTCFDAFYPVFEEILHHASTLLSNLAATVDPTSIIPSFFFTATKCRFPNLRRHAFSLIRRILSLDPPQNHSTIWTKIPTCSILLTIIAFEESTESPELPGCRTSTTPLFFNPFPETDTLPPEHVRVHHIQLQARGDEIRLFIYAQGQECEVGGLRETVVKLLDCGRGGLNSGWNDRSMMSCIPNNS